MAFKNSELQMLRGFLVRRVLLRVFMVATLIAMFPFIQFMSHIEPMEIFSWNSSDCVSGRNIFPGFLLKPLSFYVLPLLESSSALNLYKENVNLMSDVIRELMDKKILNYGAKVLCVGEGMGPAVSALRKLGFSDAFGLIRHPLLARQGFAYKLEFRDDSFDFVFSRGLDRVAVPALLVLEIERILKPGGVGAMLVGVSSFNMGSLIKIATPISSFLKSSDIVNVHRIDSFALVVFKKRCNDFKTFASNDFSSFAYYRLPNECPSVTINKPLIEYLEPLVEEKPVGTKNNISYLSKFLDISNRERLVYIDVGAGEFVSSSIAKWFLPFYPMQSRTFEIYAIDHNASVLTSYNKMPGITFVYDPALPQKQATVDFDPILEMGSSSDNPYEPPSGRFDFLHWLKETVAIGDFAVLKMNLGAVGFKLLHELFESGAICLVDELFLHCPNSTDVRDATGGDCLHLFKALRNSGVFVHQWWGD
ncbi:uncharacterized protein LOC143892070 [Tasmannia lanceolata]|uniref:uncharacterized protein LOC143892070 n=1 Tax=Tasmannia lanceolata TaxID=3420 RepID=UPI0040645DA8